ncbi:hypothetical protein [Chroococcidiopsis sp. SAG 2025]|nr:hypothetical protein [Chroococcidiopsis sp. SAG 2025]
MTSVRAGFEERFLAVAVNFGLNPPLHDTLCQLPYGRVHQTTLF